MAVSMQRVLTRVHQADDMPSPPFHEARTQAELTKLIREGKIPNLPSKYSQNLQMIVKLMLRQDVRKASALFRLS